ncbi:MAG: protein arginine kinase [Candidatus Omnitrophota bacterium]|nr:MAG: protein arginine kinase [Candidatus Omnitrophota bacterium]
MFDKFITNAGSWLSGKGPSSEIVFSSRMRLARNLKGVPFPSRANPAQREEVLKKIEGVHAKIKHLDKSFFVKMDDLPGLDKNFLIERHLISKEHTSTETSRGLVVTGDERIAIMVNEEDHLRMQVITSGFDLPKCWGILDEIDSELNKTIAFSFHPQIGYLTACPTNVGTALRASCMLHLPALVFTKRINKILELLAKISFTTRGLFGEGTQALGNFFQVSNQVCLGPSEKELMENLVGVVNQILTQEMDARDVLLKKHKITVEDSIWRAAGILTNSRLINTREALSHLSMLSLGLDLGIIKGIKKELINNLFIIIQPAHLQKIEGRQLKESERDYIRAEVLRQKLKS